MIPSPKLDDRTYQDIVDEAVSLIPRYAPEWTNHNPSDPGITLLELAAWMSDLLIFRLNQVPEKNYVAFLNLLLMVAGLVGVATHGWKPIDWFWYAMLMALGIGSGLLYLRHLRIALAPLREISRVAAEIAGGRLGSRITRINRKDELGRVSWNFNNMLDQMEACFREQRAALTCASENKFYRHMQAEGLHAGAVDQAAGVVEAVQARVGGGVFAGIQRAGDFARGGLRLGQQGVDEGGFAHAGLADQYAAVALQERTQSRYILLRAEFEHAVADGAVGFQPEARLRGGFGEVALVQYDQHLDLLVVRGDQAAREQLVAERGFGGDHDDDLRHVRGDELLAEGVGAMQQRTARGDAFDHALCAVLCGGRGGELHFHHVAAHHFAFLAARQAGQFAAVFEARQVLAAEGRDDLAVDGGAQILNSASTFAAQMKSFSDRPWMAWVLYSTWQPL